MGNCLGLQDPRHPSCIPAATQPPELIASIQYNALCLTRRTTVRGRKGFLLCFWKKQLTNSAYLAMTEAQTSTKSEQIIGTCQEKSFSTEKLLLELKALWRYAERDDGKASNLPFFDTAWGAWGKKKTNSATSACWRTLLATVTSVLEFVFWDLHLHWRSCSTTADGAPLPFHS